MRLQWIAASSVLTLLAVCALNAANRPRYGGVLRIEISEIIAGLETAAPTGTPAEALRIKLASQLSDGPFHIVHWSSNSVRLEANESYTAGRPFLDAVEIEMGKSRRDQLLDIELGHTDIAQVDVTDIRSLKQKGIVTQLSKPIETVAIVFDNRVPLSTRQAFSLSIDRLAIQRVLLDHQGEVSGALLPQWISGYAFLFPSLHDAGKAKALAGNGASLSISYDASDRVLRTIAERTIVDAAQVGLKLHPVTHDSDIQIIRLAIVSKDPSKALQVVGEAFKVVLPVNASPYESERALLQDCKIVPLFQLPLVYALGPNVRNWSADWPLADTWLEATHTP